MVDGAARRAAIVDILTRESPVTGSALSSRLGVTRQVIVQDMAVLRAQGEQIMATPRGYTLLRETPPAGVTKLIAVKHDRDNTRDELYTMVDLGAEVVDVTVEHPVYGQMTGQLALSSRSEVDEFLKTINATNAGLLSSLTKGVHLHTIRCKTQPSLPQWRTPWPRKDTSYPNSRLDVSPYSSLWPRLHAPFQPSWIVHPAPPRDTPCKMRSIRPFPPIT